MLTWLQYGSDWKVTFQGIALSERYEHQNGRCLGTVNYCGKDHSYEITYKN